MSMSKRVKLLSYQIAIVLVCSCSTNNRFDKANSSPMHLVAKSQVVIRNGQAFLRKTSTSFSGITVEFDYEFDYTKYILGKEVQAELDETQYKRRVHFTDLASKDVARQQAVRDYIGEVGPSHDFYFFYGKYGKESDLPVLLYGLKEMGESHGEYNCERDHCLGALRTITGANPGINYSDWQMWWQTKNNTEVPVWYPKMKDHNESGLNSQREPPTNQP